MHDTTLQGFQLSPQQQHLWSLVDHSGGTPLVAQRAILLEGSLDPARLQAALRHVVQQHDILRTTFRLLPGMAAPLQVISDAHIAWEATHDLRDLDDAAQQAALDDLFDVFYRQLVEIADGPPVHASLVTLAEDRHVLLLRLSALCADTPTLNNLTAQLHSAYTARASAPATELDEPIQYVIVSDWLNELLESPEAEPGKKYWRQNRFLDAATPSLPFKRANERPAATPSRLVRQSVPGELLATIEATSGASATGLDAFFLTCWHVLLHRLTDSAEVVVGVACDGRTDDELAGMLGPLSKYLPICAQLADDVLFQASLQQTSQDLGDAAAWQECFAWADFSSSDALITKQRFFPFCFEFVTQDDRYAADGITFSTYRQRVTSDRFQLKLSCTRTADDLEVQLDYDPQVYAQADIERLARLFMTLVQAAAQHPATPVSALELLDATEQHQQLVTFNQQSARADVHHCVPGLFAAQVARTPDQPALVLNEQVLSYAELNARADTLARHLRSIGVGPEVFVGLYIERSVEMIVGLLAVLKSGGVYAPLDPAYPTERLRLILDQLQPPVILTQSHLAEKLDSQTTRIICLDTAAFAQATQDPHDDVAVIAPQSLAYVIFTSGSTGAPKGVLVSHESLVTHCLAAQAQYALTMHDRVLQFAVFHFDASIEQMVPPLLSGATIVLRGDEVWDAARCASVIVEQQISVINLPTAYWHQVTQTWAAMDTPPRVSALRLAIVGGEAMQPEYRHMWQRLFGTAVRLINAYGPTEATITATTYTVSTESDESLADGVPIGRPLGQRTAYILDRHSSPVPLGVVGELHLGGDNLARGYLKQAALTAERFTPDPFSPHPGSRLYRTGDLARYLPDGRIIFAGRSDYQIKLRGFRVELAEIETALRRHSAIRDALVTTWETTGGSGEKRLVAYIVPGAQYVPTPAELRDFLLSSLPDYMIPSDIVPLQTFPMTLSGKIDRQALPAVDTRQAGTQQTYVAPRTPIEEALAQIWATVFNIPQVGVFANFFDLGGHSLIATQLVARLRAVFKAEIALRSLLAAPSIAELARVIEQALREGHGPALPPVVPIARDHERWPLSFAQERLWFLQQFEPDSPAYNIPGLIRIRGPLNPRALKQSLAALIQRHEALRTTFHIIEGQPVQMIAPTSAVELVEEDLRALPAAERDLAAQRLVTAEACRPFDLTSEVLRALLVQVDQTDYALLLTIHHIVADEWSVNLFVQELAHFYDALSVSGAPRLPEQTIHYVDFALWQRGWLQGDVLEQQLAYWKQRLHGAPVLLALPTDRPRPAVQTAHGTSQSFQLSLPLSDALKALSRQEETTLFMTLLAAFQVLLARYSGQDDILVGSPATGRTQTELEGVIGCFINTLVLRTSLSGHPTFRDVLVRVRETTLAAYAHQDVPFEKLVDELQPTRSMSHSPLFQVMFTLLHQPITEFPLAGLELSVAEIGSETTKFDLTLTMISGDRLGGSLEYNTDLFDAETIQQMQNHFVTLLEALVADGIDQPIETISLLSVAEQQQMLAWNTTATTPPPALCVHDLVAAQARRSPDAIALIVGETAMSYAELERRAGQLALQLQRLGVAPEVRVAICAERTADLIVGLLAILKAGGAYVPLDPTYPAERLAFMIEDAGVAVVVTQQSLGDQLPEQQVRSIYLDTLAWDDLPMPASGELMSAVTPDHLAYVMYTSGSTGRPKGVAITHTSVVTLLDWAQQVFSAEQLAGVLASTSISFDLSVFEIFLPLSVGGSIILADSALELPTLPARDAVTLINSVPSALSELLRGGHFPARMATINSGGEALPLTLALELLQQPTVRHIFNLYGPTEDTVYSIYTQVDRDRGLPPSIGRPISHTTAYILDAQMEPVPVGVVGELYLGGQGIARGYLNRPELTAETFIPDPFAQSTGAASGRRMYRTGDLARYHADGSITFLGRRDHQVKIRGFRIELSEIQAALLQHPAVQQAAVVATRGADDEAALVGYVVPTDTQAPSSAELRTFLSQRLPHYMLPSIFVMLTALPLTPNGKLDQRALPVPGPERPTLAVQYVAPRTPVEAELARIWTNILGIEQIGVHDNFFELGGHSLKAVQVLSRVADTFHIETSLHSLFHTPTIADFAQTLAPQENRPTSSAPIKPLSRQMYRVQADPEASLNPHSAAETDPSQT